ncbi:DUF2933 domain-containing protein [candidate division KSB1 bacterium]|nr:DUF2933 domain-containing protein [Phycisphaerae bacterium]NIP51085.1 DUF2933 domain-containing protein [Phycisphaerae bacterium]NIV92139.1 DUF2933 domain-containing protein [candidate division KSB1 bacterium]NIX31947.1 DUF2933 domain-containing protein [Phycisphaerae bacterium]
MTNQNNSENSKRPFLQSPTNVALVVFLSIAGYFLVMEHLAHIIEALPYVLLLGCMLMHVFMHRGHGGHGGHDHNSDPNKSDPESRK